MCVCIYIYIYIYIYYTHGHRHQGSLILCLWYPNLHLHWLYHQYWTLFINTANCNIDFHIYINVQRVRKQTMNETLTFFKYFYWPFLFSTLLTTMYFHFVHLVLFHIDLNHLIISSSHHCGGLLCDTTWQQHRSSCIL